MNRPKRRDLRRLRVALVNATVGTPLLTRRARRRILRAAGMELASDVLINPRCYFGGVNIAMGPGCFVNTGAFFDNTAPIRIARRVHIGPNVSIITSKHVIEQVSGERIGRVYPRPVTIHEGVGIGAGAVILSGVTIGAGTIIGAGSVVTGDCEPNAIYTGIPARKVRTFDDPA